MHKVLSKKERPVAVPTDHQAHIQWSRPGGVVELPSAMLSVEDITKAPQARLSLTGGP